MQTRQASGLFRFRALTMVIRESTNSDATAVNVCSGSIGKQSCDMALSLNTTEAVLADFTLNSHFPENTSNAINQRLLNMDEGLPVTRPEDRKAQNAGSNFHDSLGKTGTSSIRKRVL